MTVTIPPLARRQRVLASMIAMPALLTAFGICAVESWKVLQPESALFAAPFVYSLADAIERNEVDQAYAFIRAGQDPSQPIAVRHPVVTRGQSILVPPLLWAVATQNSDAALMLLGFGARFDQASAVNAICLAEAIGNADIARRLRHLAPPATDSRCEARPPGDVPLLAFAVR